MLHRKYHNLIDQKLLRQLRKYETLGQILIHQLVLYLADEQTCFVSKDFKVSHLLHI